MKINQMNSTLHWFSWLKSNDKAIIDILEKQSSNLIKATGALVELIAAYDNINERMSAIKDLEHSGDKIAHNIFDILDKTFVTPFDREDISKLTGAIDEVLDYADGTADRFVLYKIHKPTPKMLEMANVLHSASKEIHFVVVMLKKFKNAQDLIEHSAQITGFEHEGDKLYRTAIADLFENEQDAINIIKQKEIYETLEGAIDRTADVSDIIEDIALKYG
jgi:predicted phosphate transport protein (TIGR00153 family)